MNALVYSTDGGRMCPACRRPVAQCACGQSGQAAAGHDNTVRLGAGPGMARADAASPASARVRVSRETKGRAGKAVTVVRGLALDEAALAALGKRLRTACGAGGTVRDGTIEVQGDHVERVLALLQAAGWKASRSGG